MVVVSEAAGKLSFGTHGSTSGKYTLVTDSGSYQVEPEWVEGELRLQFQWCSK